MRRFTLRSLSVVTLVVAVVAVIAAPSALSAKEPDIEIITAVPISKGGQTQAAAVGITCIHKANNPHKSNHDPTKVNATSTITCDAPVSALAINPITLYRNFFAAGSGSNSNAGKAFISANAAAQCIPANYDAQSRAYITFPVGYTPRTWSGTASSALVYVSCL